MTTTYQKLVGNEFEYPWEWDFYYQHFLKRLETLQTLMRAQVAVLAFGQMPNASDTKRIIRLAVHTYVRITVVFLGLGRWTPYEYQHVEDASQLLAEIVELADIAEKRNQ